MRHSIVQKNLYDYTRGELSESDRSSIMRHLSQCTKCAVELRELEAAVRAFPQRSYVPASSRPELYWQHFSQKVERRIQEHAEDYARFSLKEFILSALEHRRHFILGFASAVVLMLVTAIVWRISVPVTPDELHAVQNEEGPNGAIRPVSIETRTYDYLEKSKILLIGLVNADPEVMEKSKVSFTREKEFSRELLRESRELTASLTDPTQQRLKRLVSDLELILVQIANLETEYNSPAIDIVRSGIQRKGILLKINLEEIQRAERFSTVKGPRQNS